MPPGYERPGLRWIVSALRNVANKLPGLLSQIGGVPLFYWVYLGVVVYMLQVYSFRFLGMGSRTISTPNGKKVKVNSAEFSVADAVVNPSDITDTFESVGGLEKIKRKLTESVIWPFSHPELFTTGSLRHVTKGVLLYGPPGTGKTLLARAVAKEMKGSFIEIGLDRLFSKYLGDSEKLAAAVFSLAEKLQPCVVFIDEIDALLNSRNTLESAAYLHVKTIFLTRWDGLTQSDSRIVVIGATNRPEVIDEAFLRRLPLRLEVTPPDLPSRRSILQLLMKGDLDQHPSRDEIVEYVALKTSGYTGSDLKELCKSAAIIPVREMMNRKLSAMPPLGKQHFDEALSVVRPTTTFKKSLA